MKAKMILNLLLLALALPLAALTSCNKTNTTGKSETPAVEAKHHYAVTMTGVT